MFRKTSVALAALLVASSAVIAPAAQAATKISNGVACAKKGATTSVGKDKYTCTTNPTETGAAATKLVWVSNICLTANTTLNKANAQLKSYMLKLANAVRLNVNSLILYSSLKTYEKGEIVYVADDTYYVALTDTKGELPSQNLGTKWALNAPATADSKIGTMPDPSIALEYKRKLVLDWTATVATLNADITKLKAKTNQDAATKKLIDKMETQVRTINSGIRLVNTRIKNMEMSIAAFANEGAKDAGAILLKSNVDTSLANRKMLCLKGL